MKLEIKTVAVIGAGTMGQGIAQVCALGGFATTLVDINAEVLQAGIIAIKNNLETAVEKNKLTVEEKEKAFQRISSVNTVAEVKADLIIEAVIENLDIKQKLFAELELINSEKTILATNTSSISITQIASKLKNPSRCIGLHFFNPAHIMKLVEIISGAVTDKSVVEAMQLFSKKINKTSVLAKDSPGFIVNRVARHFYVEALKVLEENVADHITIDALLRSAGFKMGAFELMDLIGNDINFSVTTSVYNGFHQETKFRPNRIQQQKVDAGHLGKKTGKGFYTYTKNT